MNWDTADFVIFSGMLLGAGVAYAVAARLIERRPYRVLAGLGIALVFLLVWAELAVGIFD